MRHRSSPRNKYTIWLLTFLLLLSVLIIGASIYFHQAPNKTSKYIWSKITGEDVELEPTVDFLVKELDSKNKLIDSLSSKLKTYEKINIHKKALVNVETGTLNMRDKPILASSIIARIPDSSFVDVLYFDTKTYYLGGKSGRWCKIKYADQEGWVWDGFIVIQ